MLQDDMDDPEPGLCEVQERTETGRKSTCQKNEGRRKRNPSGRERRVNVKAKKRRNEKYVPVAFVDEIDEEDVTERPAENEKLSAMAAVQHRQQPVKHMRN